MPLKVQVGLSKKIGQPAYGSLGASCHVEFEAASELLQHDVDGFHRQIESVFALCRQAVQDELYRARDDGSRRLLPVQEPDTAPSDQPPSSNGNGERPGDRRRATASQVRAIQAITNRLQLDPAPWLHEKFGLINPAELSLPEAS
jgi:hypothetical protein